MRRTHLLLLVGVAALSVAIFGFNLKLYKLNRQIKSQRDSLIRQELSTSAPAPGWVMPVIHGKKMDGKDPELDFQGSAEKMTIMLFDSVNCPACDQNWTFWDRLLSDEDITSRLVAVSNGPVSWAYIHQHPLISTNHMVVTELDPSIAKQMRMQAAPQTIYLEHGTVKKVWFGLLSDAEVKEIRNQMKMDD